MKRTPAGTPQSEGWDDEMLWPGQDRVPEVSRHELPNDLTVDHAPDEGASIYEGRERSIYEGKEWSGALQGAFGGAPGDDREVEWEDDPSPGDGWMMAAAILSFVSGTCAFWSMACLLMGLGSAHVGFLFAAGISGLAMVVAVAVSMLRG